MIKKPMLASAVEDLSLIQYPVLATPKLDGIRCLIVDGKAVSRKLKPIPNHYIRTTLEKLCPEGFDGEIVCQGKTFNETQSLVMTEEGEPDFHYWVFDWLKDSEDKPYSARLEDMRLWLATAKDMTKLVMLFPTTVPDSTHLTIMLNECLLNGYEGTMIRSPDGLYKFGRSTVKQGWLLKLKIFQDAEAVVLGFEEKMHNNNEATVDELGHTKRSSHKANLVGANTLGALLVKGVDNGIEFSIGTGFDDVLRKEIWENKEAYLGRLVTFKFQPSGAKERPRFPVFKGFRDERDM